jgi:phage gp36-like protein
MSYCSQQDIELRIGTAQLRQLTNDTWSSAAPAITATPKSGGSLSGTFFYVVTALNQKGETIKSNEVTFTSGAVNKTATITWTAIATATSYKIYKSSVSGVYTSPSLLIQQTALTYDDTGSVSTLLTGSPPVDVAIPDATIVSGILDKANSEIDAKAGQVYTVPFVAGTNCTSIPSIIKQIAIDLSTYFCFMRRFSEMEVPKQWIEAYKDACSRLEDVSNMLLKLDGSPTIASSEADMVTGNQSKIDFYNTDNQESHF